jgi:predicted GIY-YIG superfamily endonuclease
MIFQEFVENFEQKKKAFEFEIFIRKSTKAIKNELV